MILFGFGKDNFQECRRIRGDNELFIVANGILTNDFVNIRFFEGRSGVQWMHSAMTDVTDLWMGRVFPQHIECTEVPFQGLAAVRFGFMMNQHKEQIGTAGRSQL